MDRRSFLKAAAAVPAAGLADGLVQQSEAEAATPKPNILFVMVDELRFPSVFPKGINSPAEFLAKFMPNVHRLWKSGVKFGSHYNAANACTPSRGALISGLYSHQSWLLQTLLGGPYSNTTITPILNHAYPTYGKLLQKAGYQTPYIGKWHVSIPGPQSSRLSDYGFQGLTYYDPTGNNLQGSVGDVDNGFLSDADIATQAAEWLAIRSKTTTPWCLTVSFINPHDHEFFWAGTEFERYNELFGNSGYKPVMYYSYHDGTYYPPVVMPKDDVLKSPPSYGYPLVPPNWESAAQIALNKPTTQSYARNLQGAVWGAVTDDPAQQSFTITAYPNPKDSSALTGLGVGNAPFGYWRRGMDCYTQVITLVDQRIGTVLDALPADVARNTIIVFTSDHGDYAGAHGFIAGKIGSVYDEAYHVPLIVSDPTGHFTGDIETVRTELTSSVDVMGMLVSLGYGGTRSWLTAELSQPYASRHDMIPMLRSSAAAGRPYVLLVTDEQAQGIYNYNDSPPHIIGVRTKAAKLGMYAHWIKGTTRIDPSSVQLEYYDYSTVNGQLELDSTPYSAGAKALLSQLVTEIIPDELRAPIAQNLKTAQHYSERAYIRYLALENGVFAP
jgi:uncharacterized sulfatase